MLQQQVPINRIQHHFYDGSSPLENLDLENIAKDNPFVQAVGTRVHIQPRFPFNHKLKYTITYLLDYIHVVVESIQYGEDKRVLECKCESRDQLIKFLSLFEVEPTI